MYTTKIISQIQNVENSSSFPPKWMKFTKGQSTLKSIKGDLKEQSTGCNVWSSSVKKTALETVGERKLNIDKVLDDIKKLLFIVLDMIMLFCVCVLRKTPFC